MSVAAMVRGWCPGALRPMESGDGLIVRLRISSGIVSVGLVEQIAHWSRRWGNGQIDLSTRANLQLRGLSTQHLPKLHDALTEWGLLDSSKASEAIRNVISSPLAGLDLSAVLDVQPVVQALEQRLLSQHSLHSLPGKFGFAVDDGGLLGLDNIAADVRFVACCTVNGPRFKISLAGAPDDHFGPCEPNEVANTAEALAQAFLSLRSRRETKIRRMRDLVRAHGAVAIGHMAGLGLVRSPQAARIAPPLRFLGAHALGMAGFLGIGLPFGRITADDLARLAAATAAHGAQEMRLTPWQAALVPVPSTTLAHSLLVELAESPFILDHSDPRRRVAACPGAPSCISATTPVRSDAADVAARMANMKGWETIVHVSGCAKGCAHPAAAPVTLVARNGRYDLVLNGTASSPPVLRNLTLDQATEQVQRTAADPLPGRAA